MLQENLSSGFLTRIDTNRPVCQQKIARSLKFQIQENESLYYQCSKNKSANPMCDCRAADLHLCFRIYKKQFFSPPPTPVSYLQPLPCLWRLVSCLPYHICSLEYPRHTLPTPSPCILTASSRSLETCLLSSISHLFPIISQAHPPYPLPPYTYSLFPIFGDLSLVFHITFVP